MTMLGTRLSAIAALAFILPANSDAHVRPVPAVVSPNTNTSRAGVLRNGVLTVNLEAKESRWYLDGRARPPMRIEAFAEPGKDPLMPGPLIRAPQGTELRLSIRNSLRQPLTLLLPAVVRGGPAGSALDSLVIAPGTVGVDTARLTTPGSYPYRASTPTGASRVPSAMLACSPVRSSSTR